MERQAVGLRYKPALMLIDDADTPAKWYYKLKAAYLASVQTWQPLDHPLEKDGSHFAGRVEPTQPAGFP